MALAGRIFFALSILLASPISFAKEYTSADFEGQSPTCMNYAPTNTFQNRVERCISSKTVSEIIKDQSQIADFKVAFTIANDSKNSGLKSARVDLANRVKLREWALDDTLPPLQICGQLIPKSDKTLPTDAQVKANYRKRMILAVLELLRIKRIENTLPLRSSERIKLLERQQKIIANFPLLDEPSGKWLSLDHLLSIEYLTSGSPHRSSNYVSDVDQILFGDISSGWPKGNPESQKLFEKLFHQEIPKSIEKELASVTKFSLEYQAESLNRICKMDLCSTVQLFSSDIAKTVSKKDPVSQASFFHVVCQCQIGQSKELLPPIAQLSLAATSLLGLAVCPFTAGVGCAAALGLSAGSATVLTLSSGVSLMGASRDSTESEELWRAVKTLPGSTPATVSAIEKKKIDDAGRTVLALGEVALGGIGFGGGRIIKSEIAASEVVIPKGASYGFRTSSKIGTDDFMELRKHSKKEPWVRSGVDEDYFYGDPFWNEESFGRRMMQFLKFDSPTGKKMKMPMPELLSRRLDELDKIVKGEKIPIRFYGEAGQKVSDRVYLKRFATEGRLPIQNPHDMNWHLRAISVPKKWTEHSQAQARLASEFDEFITQNYPHLLKDKLGDRAVTFENAIHQLISRYAQRVDSLMAQPTQLAPRLRQQYREGFERRYLEELDYGRSPIDSLQLASTQILENGNQNIRNAVQHFFAQAARNPGNRTRLEINANEIVPTLDSRALEISESLH